MRQIGEEKKKKRKEEIDEKGYLDEDLLRDRLHAELQGQLSATLEYSGSLKEIVASRVAVAENTNFYRLRKEKREKRRKTKLE
jgi:hypothetical protein